jgi:hypothetical protein
MFRLFLIIVVLVMRVAFSQTASYAERVASTLDPAEKFKPGASLFWSPTAQAAWDQLKNYHGVKAIELDPHTPVADVLNNFVWDAGKTLPDGTVVYGGDDSEKLREDIRHMLRLKIGANAAAMIGPYQLPGRVREDVERLHSALFVSCLAHAPRFPASFKASNAPFRLSNGEKPRVAGFGCAKDEVLAHFDVVQILADDRRGSFLLKITFFTGEKARPEFMLVGTKPQLTSLAEGIEWMKRAMKQPLPVDQVVSHNNAWWRYHNQLTPADVFWMPKLKTKLACDFGELIGKSYLKQTLPNGWLAWWEIREAQQLIVFKLDEEGALAHAVLRVAPDFLAAAGGSGLGPKPSDATKLPPLPRRFVFDQPFVMALWMRGAEWPYLASWVDSEDVLVKK